MQTFPKRQKFIVHPLICVSCLVGCQQYSSFLANHKNVHSTNEQKERSHSRKKISQWCTHLLFLDCFRHSVLTATTSYSIKRITGVYCCRFPEENIHRKCWLSNLKSERRKQRAIRWKGLWYIFFLWKMMSRIFALNFISLHFLSWIVDCFSCAP